LTKEIEMKRKGLVVLGALVIAFPGCGGGGGGGGQDAADTAGGDTAGDQVTDTSPDAQPDSTPDTEPDVAPDAEPDPVEDPPEDWPTDLPADWPTETSSSCAAAGGFCTEYDWDMCPPGYEPTAPNTDLDCSGHCCIVAPYSPCSAATYANCIMAESCTGCWGDPSPAYDCESGRICCTWYCE
jgi:hypothetical protein